MHHHILVTLNMLIPLCKTTDFLQLDPLIEASFSWHSLEINQPSVWSLILERNTHARSRNVWIYKDLYTAGTRVLFFIYIKIIKLVFKLTYLGNKERVVLEVLTH